jgi:ABC-type thiamin/hydroxymethylpyrimidine transport system permease subunit
MIMFLKWFKLPDFLANFIAVLGLEMSPAANISFCIWLLAMKFTKASINVPGWQTIVILLMLLVQLLSAII